MYDTERFGLGVFFACLRWHLLPFVANTWQSHAGEVTDFFDIFGVF